MLIGGFDGLVGVRLRDLLDLLAVEHGLTCVDHLRRLKLHALIQIEVEVGQLELARDLGVASAIVLVALEG